MTLLAELLKGFAAWPHFVNGEHYMYFTSQIVIVAVSIKHGLRTTDSDYGLGIKHGLGIKRGLSITDWV